jgi:hypothetical protein
MRLITILIAVALAWAHSSVSAQPALERWIVAAGGRHIWDNVKTIEYTITTVWYDTSGVEVRRRPRHVWLRKDPGAYKVRVERTEAAGDYVQAWDGARAWATLNGASLADTAQAVREVPYVTGDLAYWIALPWKLTDPGVNIRYEGDSIMHVSFGRGVGLHDGDRYWYYWRDRASPFPTDVEYIEQGKTEKERIVWSEWQSFGRAVYSSKRTRVDSRGRVTRGFLITNIKVNQPMPASLFNGR